MSTQESHLAGYVAPVFTIDLSQKPRDRYKALAMAYRHKVHGLVGLFNNLLGDLGIPVKYHSSINLIARLLLRRVHSSVETAELRGVADVTNVSMYLLVAFNVILDLLMGCTSGAVKTLEPGHSTTSPTMLHFRNLDWTMDPLRSVVVQLNFVRTKSADPTHVLARSLTYVGYVGMLTAVRPQLSMSLNFRALHNATTRTDHFKFYFNHLLVLLGLRQSISSNLRSYMISEDRRELQVKSLATIAEQLPHRRTTAAYLIFSDGGSTIVLEKDYKSARVRQSNTFIAATNHDVEDHGSNVVGFTPATSAASDAKSRFAGGMGELLEDSEERLECMSSKWTSHVRKTNRLRKNASRSSFSQAEARTASTFAQVVDWLSAYPTTNEETHFGVIMDPSTGEMLWTRVYPDPEGLS
ncbi:hypothetical protein B0A52_04826 [Exophiala mesophila]|uniref:ceramidase n=1 Tax=Exophiala mesophila TaxID=212818 RepID=A0A438N6J9_EXOME|nr:hypothetical protein B0A52_04826 [Exophiala mesophila]